MDNILKLNNKSSNEQFKTGGGTSCYYDCPQPSNSNPAAVSLSPQVDTKDPKWWLKLQRFKVTNSLLARIADYPKNEQEIFCYMQNIVVYLSQDEPWMFVDVGAKYFQDKCKGYLRYLTTLEQWGELQRNWKGGYCNDATKSKDGKTRPYSYRIPAAAWNSGIVIKDFRCKKRREPVDTSTVTGAEYDSVAKNYAPLFIQNNPIIPDHIDFDYAVRCFMKIDAAVVNLRVGKKGGREFHTIIEMARELRANIKHRSGKRLGEGDIKCAHIFFLAKFCEAEERERYIQLVSNHDVYTKIPAEMGKTLSEKHGKWKTKNGKKKYVVFRKKKTARDVAKEDFLLFVDGCHKNYVYRYYKKHFPILTARIMELGKDGMAKTLQRLESEIMRGKVKPECDARGLYYLSEHDGWFGFEDDAAEIAQIVIREVKKEVGFAPKIKFTALEDGAEVEFTETSEIEQISPNFSEILKNTNDIKSIRRDKEDSIYVMDNREPCVNYSGLNEPAAVGDDLPKDLSEIAGITKYRDNLFDVPSLPPPVSPLRKPVLSALGRLKGLDALASKYNALN